MNKIKLTAICNPKQWKTLSTNELQEDGFPVYGANGVIGYYSEYNHEDPVIAITCRGATCGTINVTVPKSYVTGNAMCLDNLDSDVNLDYLYYCLLNYDFSNVISGSAQPQITRQGLERVFVPICEKTNQNEIVSVLSKIEKLIKYQEREIQLFDEFIKARFVELFGDPITNEKGWATKKLNDVCPVNKYKGEVDSAKGKVWLLNLDMVESETGRIIDYVYEDEEKIASSTIKFDSNCVLYSKLRPYLNKVVVPNRSGYATSEMISMQTGEVNKYYLSTLMMMKSFVDWANGTSYGAKMPRASVDSIKNFDLMLPPKSLQNEFEELYKQLDKSKFVCQKKIELYQELLNKKMDEYFNPKESKG